MIQYTFTLSIPDHMEFCSIARQWPDRWRVGVKAAISHHDAADTSLGNIYGHASHEDYQEAIRLAVEDCSTKLVEEVHRRETIRSSPPKEVEIKVAGLDLSSLFS